MTRAASAPGGAGVDADPAYDTGELREARRSDIANALKTLRDKRTEGTEARQAIEGEVREVLRSLGLKVVALKKRLQPAAWSRASAGARPPHRRGDQRNTSIENVAAP